MDIIGLDGKEYMWNVSKYFNNERSTASSGHKKARTILNELFPFDKALEELMLPGTGKLCADFFIPTRRLMIEVHGRQHFEFVQFFHKNRVGFMMSQVRDRNKAEWCKLNDITLIVLKDTEEDEWRNQIGEG